MASLQEVCHDYATIGLSLKGHLVSFIRTKLHAMDTIPCADLKDEARWPNGKPISVAGVVLIRQRPGTASGIVFIAIEDETGIANLIVRPSIFERDRKAARHGVTILVRGKVERQGMVVHVMAQRLIDLSHEIADLDMSSWNFY